MPSVLTDMTNVINSYSMEHVEDVSASEKGIDSDQEHHDDNAKRLKADTETYGDSVTVSAAAAPAATSLSDDSSGVPPAESTQIEVSEPPPITARESKASRDVAPDNSSISPALFKAQFKWASGVIRSLKRHGEAGPFLNPVDPLALGIPDYFKVIARPMDLSSVEKKLTGSAYTSISEFVDDVSLIFSNCFAYNPPSHPVHTMGRNVEKAFTAQLKRLPRTEEDLRTDSGRTNGAPSSPSVSRPKREVPAPVRDFSVDLGSNRKLQKRTYEDMRWCNNVWREMMKKQYQATMFIFYSPVDPVALNIPTYFDVVKQPMDLSTIKKKLDRHEYESADEFEADFRLMFSNCFLFNRPEDDVYRMGKSAEAIFDKKWSERPPPPPAGSSQHSSHLKKKRRFEGHHSRSDDDSSSDEEYAANQMQIRMMEQQIAFLQSQLETLRQSQRKGRKDRKKSRSRRSSKGSTSIDATPNAAKPSAPRPPKQARPPKAKKVEELREITFEEKKALSEAINTLSGDRLGRVVQIIHESMPQLKGENGQEEIELDIDSLDLTTLNRLWNFVKGNKRKRQPTATKTGTGDAVVDAARINELERELAMMDGRVDKMKKLSGGKEGEVGITSVSHSASDRSESGSESDDNSESGSELA